MRRIHNSHDRVALTPQHSRGELRIFLRDSFEESGRVNKSFAACQTARRAGRCVWPGAISAAPFIDRHDPKFVRESHSGRDPAPERIVSQAERSLRDASLVLPITCRIWIPLIRRRVRLDSRESRIAATYRLRIVDTPAVGRTYARTYGRMRKPLSGDSSPYALWRLRSTDCCSTPPLLFRLSLVRSQSVCTSVGPSVCLSVGRAFSPYR